METYFAKPGRPKKKRKKTPQSALLSVLGRIFVVVIFVGGIYSAGWLGIEMAKERSAPAEKVVVEPVEESTFTIGSANDPIYLANSPDELRQFFVRFPTVESRAAAPTGDNGIRRVSGAITLESMKEEADATNVRVASGAIAGAVYWIHYSQMKPGGEDDSILSPVPE